MVQNTKRPLSLSLSMALMGDDDDVASRHTFVFFLLCVESWPVTGFYEAKKSVIVLFVLETVCTGT